MAMRLTSSLENLSKITYAMSPDWVSAEKNHPACLNTKETTDAGSVVSFVLFLFVFAEPQRCTVVNSLHGPPEQHLSHPMLPVEGYQRPQVG